MSYQCKTCGEIHEKLPALGFGQPDYAGLVPAKQRQERVKLDDDFCVVDDEFFFIHVSLSIPIRDHEQNLNLGVWASQTKENILTCVQNFASAEIGPYFGWLANDFKFGGESTLNLETMVHFQGGGFRPFIKLGESEHPLSIAQRDGMSMDEAWLLIHENLRSVS